MVTHGVDWLTAITVWRNKLAGLGGLCVRDAVAETGPDADVIIDGHRFVPRRRHDLFYRRCLAPGLFVRVEDDVVDLVLAVAQAGRRDGEGDQHLHQVRR